MSSSNDQGTDLGRLVLAGEGIKTVTRIAEGIFLSPGISNSYLIQTRDGDVAVNTGSAFESEHHKARYAEVSKGPLRFVIFTQGHSDHIGGAASLAGPVTQIIAQAQYPQVRGYWNRLSAFYGARTRVLWRSVIGDTAGTRAQPKDPTSISAKEGSSCSRSPEGRRRIPWRSGSRTSARSSPGISSDRSLVTFQISTRSAATRSVRR